MKSALYAHPEEPTGILWVKDGWVVNGGYRVLYDNKDKSVRLSTREHGKEAHDKRRYWLTDVSPDETRHYNDVIDEYREGMKK